ncbi:MAG TPA: hypothetical protein VKR80_07435 [Candidatus Limnocylindria bacterium]|nr:hypothetical protein [Candidatus Limnocylindria bacterium]
MPLQEASLAFKLVGGIETKLDPKTVPTLRVLDLQNGVFARGGSVKKRNGYRKLSEMIEGGGSAYVPGRSIGSIGSVAYSQARQLGARSDELLLFTDVRGMSYLPATDTWNDIGQVRSAVATETPFARTGTDQTAADHATNGGITVLAWEDSRGGIWWTTLEASTGRVLLAPTQLDALGQRPRCVAVGNVLHVYYASPSLGFINVAIVNPSTPTVLPSSAAQLSIDLDPSNPAFDACPTTFTADDPGLICWASQSGGITIGYVQSSGQIGTPTEGLPSPQKANVTITGTLGAVACAFAQVGGGPQVGIAWTQGGTSIAAAPLNASTLQNMGGIASLAADTSDGGAVTRVTCAWSLTLSSDGTPRLYFAGDVVPTNHGNARIIATWVDTAFGQEYLAAPYTAGIRSLGLAGRMIGLPTGVFVPVVYESKFFGTYYTLELYDDPGQSILVDVVGRHRPGLAVGLPTRSHLPSFQADPSSASAAAFAAPYHEVVPLQPGTFAETGLARISIEMLDRESWQSGQLGACTYLGGANMRQYDGRRWAEAGFHYGIDSIPAPTFPGAGNLTASAAYGWVIVPEEVNGQGEIDRGPVSTVIAATVPGVNSKASLMIPTLRLTARQNVRLAVYRSAANDPSIYYRVTSLDPSAGGENNYLPNSQTVDIVPFVDNMSDAVLITKERLYTTGGVPSNDPPPTGRALAIGARRVFWSDPFDPNLVRYSQQLAEGYGAELPALLAIRMPPFGGPVTGLAVMDDALIVFKRNAIYFVGGPGPDANPSGASPNGFSEPVLITSDVGATSATSVVSTPIGLMFQTGKGIWRLGRDRQTSYVGAPVEAFNGQTVRAAAVPTDRTQVLFVCDTGVSLLFDHYFQQWSTFTNHNGMGAIVVDDQLYYLRNDGRVFAETIGQYRDDNSRITMLVATAWVHLQEYLQGLQHVYHMHLIGTWQSAHTLQIDHQIDYRDGWNAPVFFDATGVDGTYYDQNAYDSGQYGGVPNTAYQWRVHLGQPCESIRFRFQDSEALGQFGASYELTEILLTGGVMAPSLRPFPAARTA